MSEDRILNASYRYHQDGSVDNLRALLLLTKNTQFSERATIYYLLLSVFGR